MRKRGVWRRLSGVVLVVFVLLSVGAPAAQAHSISGLQWTSVDVDCAGGACVTQGNQVGAWQSILWADGLLNKCGSSGIDGYFGSVTKTATQTWQRTHGLSADGVVGPLTWGAARKRLSFISRAFLPSRSGRPLTPVQYWDYVGSAHTVHFQYSDPVWAFRAPANPKTLPYFATTHPSIFFTRC